MDCRQLRDSIERYLDSELESPGKVALEEHLDACGECRNRVRAESLIQSRLRRLYADEVTPAALRERIHAQVLTEAPHAVSGESRRPVALAFRTRWLPVTAAAAAILAALLVLRTVDRDRPDEAAQEVWAAGLAADITANHGPTGREDLVALSDPVRLATLFEEHGSFRPQLPPPPVGGRLLGGQLCLVNGKRVVHAVYMVEGMTVSYFVVPYVSGPERTGDGRTSGFNYLTRVSPEGSVYVMSTAPRRELARLLS
jgi:mycothiol system anti-sigma-R factor